MRTLFIGLLLFLVGPFSAGSTEQEIQKELEAERQQFTCGSETAQKLDYRFCYRNLNTTNSNDIIYFFHGLEGSEETWFTQYLGTLVIQKIWKDRGYRPRIVTISLGPQWLLVDNSQYPLLSLVSKQIIPELERKIGGLKTGKRHLIGQSMGGFNAAEISLKVPGLFSRVALLCPAITTVGPYSSYQEVEDYIFRTGASPDMVARMLNISRSVFQDQNDWHRHDPLQLLKKYHSPRKSQFYISIGMDDEYGFQEGAEKFHQMAKSRGFSSHWKPMGGGHCNFSRKEAAGFIMGDSL